MMRACGFPALLWVADMGGGVQVGALEIAASGMRAQGQRLRHVAENIANIDTPGYRRKLIEFKSLSGDMRSGGPIAAGPVRLDRSALPEVYDPAHPLSGADGFYLGSNVDLLVEIADSREAGRSYEANLRVFEQSRQMGGALIDLLRR